MKIRKKTLDAIHSMLTEWHGMEEAGNSLVNFHPQPVGIDSLLDKIVARAVPPWERKLNEIKLAHLIDADDIASIVSVRGGDGPSERDLEPEGFSAAAENAAEHFAHERWRAPKNPFKGGRR